MFRQATFGLKYGLKCESKVSLGVSQKLPNSLIQICFFTKPGGLKKETKFAPVQSQRNEGWSHYFRPENNPTSPLAVEIAKKEENRQEQVKNQYSNVTHEIECARENGNEKIFCSSLSRLSNAKRNINHQVSPEVMRNIVKCMDTDWIKKFGKNDTAFCFTSLGKMNFSYQNSAHRSVLLDLLIHLLTFKDFSNKQILVLFPLCRLFN